MIEVWVLEGESRSAEDAVLCRGLGNAVWGTVCRGPSFSTHNPLKEAEPMIEVF